MTLFFGDCEAFGRVPAKGALTEFALVTQKRAVFHGVLMETIPDPTNSAIPMPKPGGLVFPRLEVARAAAAFIKNNLERPGDRATLVSDNPAFDFMWLADLFWTTLDDNPLGFSARRIGDYYAGLVRDFSAATRWKKLRITDHDHNPVNDALGNLEAWERMTRGERV